MSSAHAIEKESPALTRAESPPADQRVSTLVGDRLCVQCSYNLVGQSILREPHYQLLIVRCPECGTVAPLQEYPLLGRWAQRWAVLLAGLWLIIMLGVAIGGGAAIFGFSMGTAHESTRTFAQFLSTKYQAHAQLLAAAGGLGAPGYSPADMQAWRDAQDMNALFREAGGWRTGVNWDALYIWIPGSICAFLIGCFVSVAVMAHARGTRCFAGLLVMIIAAAFSYLFGYLPWTQQQVGWYWNDALVRIGPPMLLISLVIASLALCAGLLLGRRLARGLIRILLPPRLVQSFALLWTVEGRQPPRVR